MKSKKNKQKKPRPDFALGRGFFPYVLLLIFSLVFTQALKSPVSVVLFRFMLILPILMLIMAFSARSAVAVFVHADETKAEKNVPVPYEFSIINSSIFPLAYLEADISVPRTDGVFCTRQLVVMSILPKGKYIISDNIVFKYRGKYSVGVGDVYVSDMLRLFVLKREVDTYYEMNIMPRRMYLSRGRDNAPSDMPTDSHMVVSGVESSETDRIREYRAGDQLKHVHWKLSSKVDELQVNEYKPNTGKNVYVFCDFSMTDTEKEEIRENEPVKKKKEKKKRRIKLKLQRLPESSKATTVETLDAIKANAASRAEAAAATERMRAEIESESLLKTDDTEIDGASAPDAEGDDYVIDSAVFSAAEADYTEYYRHANDIIPEYVEDMDYYCADGTSELAIGAVLHELDHGNTVTLMWFDMRTESGFSSYTLRSYSDLDLIFERFATAPLVDAEFKVTRLPELIDDVQNPTFIYATAKADLLTLPDFTEANNTMGAESSEILFFNPAERYEYPSLRSEYVEMCRGRFAEHNITLTETRV